MTSIPLPWERDSGVDGVGVCLSGGGIRAAAFALGAVQSLQADRRLLFGEDSARYLAVVSGGSYLAATQTLNSAKLASEPALPPTPAPLAEGSPEAAWVVGHGEYLRAGGLGAMALRFGAPGLLNLLAFAALFVWAGTLLAGTSLVVPLDPWSGDLVFVGGALSLAVGGGILLRGMYKDGGWQRVVLRLLGIVLLFGLSPSLVAAMDRYDYLSETAWWAPWLRPEVLIILGVAAGLVAIGSLLAWKPVLGESVTVWVNRLAVFVPRLGGLVLLSLAATWAAHWLDGAVEGNLSDSDELTVLGRYFGILVAGVAFSLVAARVSLHGTYRRRLSACFAVRRSASEVELLAPTATRLSELAPPEPGSPRSFPRLLICATANVVTGRWGDGSKRTFVPFVLSHDRCGVSDSPDATFDTGALEARRVPAALPSLGKEPQLSLMTGVASTGAAISPSMGNTTMPAARALIAIVNLRLGRWLPNPLSDRIRTEVENGEEGRHVALGGGYDEFVPELFGMHRSDAPTVYLSDGGHYDNLGLMALLRARCSEIWCVDSEADKQGKAGQLRQVIGLARQELGVEIGLDPSMFAGTDGILKASHAIAPIRYGDGEPGRLVVIKLGLTNDTCAELKDRRSVDPKFPYHSTFRYLAFTPARLEAYRRLGAENARAAVAAVKAADGQVAPAAQVATEPS